MRADETYLPPETTTAAGASAVSWAAILAGAAAAVAASLTLFALAAGLDLMLAALALVGSQWIAAALGGYLTGRLRTRWAATPAREVCFRDSAHGFITWCVATVFMASGLVAAASAVVGTRSHMGGAVYGRSAIRVASSEPADSIATAHPATSTLMTAPAVPRAYGELVLPDGPGSATAVEARQAAALAGHSPQWPLRELRVSAAAPREQQESAAAGSMLTALSTVIGAFIASVSAVLGGRRRDLHP